MNIEFLVIGVVVSVAAVLAGVIGYLWAISRGKQALAEANKQLVTANAANTQHEASLLALGQDQKQLQAQVQQQALEQQKTQTELTAVQERKQELETDMEQLAKKLETASGDKHHAEKVSESAQTELKSIQGQQRELQERLDKQTEELKEERNSTSALKDKLADVSRQAKVHEVKAEENLSQLQASKTKLTEAEEKMEALQGRYESLNQQYTELKTSQEEREASHGREVAAFEKQKQDLTQEFKVLSSEILAANTKSLQESSKLTLSSVMNPFQQSIDNFKKEVQDIHHRETSQQGELKKELEQLKELNQKITTEAHELSTALRGQKKLQGNWGELVLENVLDRSGLQLGKDYKREVSISTEEGRQRPDAVVYLPQDKHLIIDAKVSLNAYTRYINATDEAERDIALDEHVKAMGDRIKELADRDYYKLPGLNSPEMVFMFVPIESAFVEALKADETLFQSAIENNVLVATPTTLLTSLNIVRQLWRYEDQNKHTAALAKKAESVFKKMNSFLASFEGVKKGLDKAAEAYTKAEGQLVSGKGNLVKQVGEFKSLAPAIKAELPGYFTDKADLEIDYIPAQETETGDSATETNNDGEAVNDQTTPELLIEND